MSKECRYGECQMIGIRHFCGFYFCQQHNRYLREAAQNERPDNLTKFVERQLTEART